ncbi:hypothetical protein ACJIZ3_016389 [Penstemon smallii]|uniref:Uncharacterized protein n=1 Tax=Penstemon smallii TaxID=265156 RepID=A0ABD3RT03_9LAMI
MLLGRYLYASSHNEHVSRSDPIDRGSFGRHRRYMVIQKFLANNSHSDHFPKTDLLEAGARTQVILDPLPVIALTGHKVHAITATFEYPFSGHLCIIHEGR